MRVFPDELTQALVSERFRQVEAVFHEAMREVSSTFSEFARAVQGYSMSYRVERFQFCGRCDKLFDLEEGCPCLLK